MNWFTDHPSSLLLPNGMPFSYIHAILIVHLLITWLVTLPLFISIRSGTRDIGVGCAVRNVVLANPLRLVRDLYNINISMASVPSERKAKAVQELGRSRSPMVAADLAAMLEDPSTDVREEAVVALGEIGGDEAIDILLRALENPHHSDLAAQIARALRNIGSPRSVDALTLQLESDDRETRTESVRALGKIADNRAAAPLLKLLREETDEKLIGHSCEALARLNERVAVYEIFPRMRNTENRILKRSLATALGSFFGEPDAFYLLFAKELSEPGSEIERLLRTAQRQTEPIPGNRHAEGEPVTLFRTAYERGQWAQCMGPLLSLARQAANRDFERDNAATLHEQNPLAASILWLIERLHDDREKELRPVEVLLGLYVLSCWPSPV